MKKINIGLICAIGCGLAYAQHIEKDFSYSAHTYQPEQIDQISPSIQKFIKNREATKSIRKVVLKSDLKGRRIGKTVQSADSTVYNVNDLASEKIPVIVTRTDVVNSNIESISGRIDLRGETPVHWLNGQKVSQAQFTNKTESWKKKYDESKKGIKGASIEYLTIKEIQDLAKSSKNVLIDEVPSIKAEEYVSCQGCSPNGAKYATPDEMLRISKIDEFGHKKNIKGRDIGIHYTDLQCAKHSMVNKDPLYREVACADYGSHALGVMKVLRTVAPKANIYGSSIIDVYGDPVTSSVALPNSQSIHPENPESFNPPIYIGTHSYGLQTNTGDQYTNYDMELDNYVYNNRTIEFKAAGNDNSYVSSPGKAFNVITVGAVEPESPYSYVAYSNYINPNTKNDKPEILNFTYFHFPNGTPYASEGLSIFNGTSASAPYSAGMAALLLSNAPGLRWHPEIVKAMFLSASTLSPSAINKDTDASYKAKIPMFDKMIKSTTGFFDTSNDSLFVNGAPLQIKFDKIKKGARYRVAISWLTSGTFVRRNKKIGQDLDLCVFQDGSNKTYYSSSAQNSFEVTEFTAESNADVTIQVTRYANYNSEERVVLGYSLTQIN